MRIKRTGSTCTLTVCLCCTSDVVKSTITLGVGWKILKFPVIVNRKVSTKCSDLFETFNLNSRVTVE